MSVLVSIGDFSRMTYLSVGVAGPIREYYLPFRPGDENVHSIEVGWPVFLTSRTGP